MSESHATAEPTTASSRPFRVVANADVVRTTLELANALVDECRIRFDEAGLHIGAVDAALVASVDLTVEPAAFDTYQVSECCIGVDLERLRDIVGMAARDQAVELVLDRERGTLEIGIGELAYTLGLLDPESIRSPPDHSEFECEFSGGIVTEADEIERAVRAAEMVSDHLVFRIDEDDDLFCMEADGDTDELSLELPSSTLVEFEPGDARSMFSIEYVKPVQRAIPSGAEIDLEIGTETPVAVRAGFADGAGAVEYLISPRISRQ